MANWSLRRHGNVPQRRATVLPRVAKCIALLALEAESPETGSDPATARRASTPVEEHVMDTVSDEELSSAGSCEVEKCLNWSHKRKSSESSRSSEKWQRHPDKNVKALLKKLRLHPEAQRILGNSRVAVVSLERLDVESVLLSLRPVVRLARLPCDASPTHPLQKGRSQSEADVWEINEGSAQNKVEEPSDLSQAGAAASWTEPYCPDSPPSEGPEQDSGFDCESNPDQHYILCDSGSDDGKTDSGTFYLDPDAEQTLVIELDPGADQGRCRLLVGESDAKDEADVVQLGDSEDQRADLHGLSKRAESPVQQGDERAEGPEVEEMESEDFCAVCLNGGDLLCCDRCPKVYHLACHIPPLIRFPVGDWMCTLCRTDQEPAEAYDCENVLCCGGVKAPYTLSNQHQRRCERLTQQLYCHTLSAPFHEPVSSLARNYYQIIKRPIDLSVIRKKLDKSNTLHYFTAEQFVDDVFLMFKNCATFNYPDSEVAQAGRNLELFFLSKLTEVFPDQTFPSASQVRTDEARLRWLNRKRRENYRRKKCKLPGKTYIL